MTLTGRNDRIVAAATFNSCHGVAGPGDEGIAMKLTYPILTVCWLLALTGCSESVSLLEPRESPPVIHPPTLPPSGPTLPISPGIYIEVEPIYGGPWFSGHGSLISRYVIVPTSQSTSGPSEGRFALEFASATWGNFAYAGSYVQTDSIVAFAFDAWSISGPWVATAVLRGDVLSVKYNIDMMLSDFMDGDYVRDPGALP